MIVGLIFAILLALFSGVCKAVMDLSSENKFVKKWWNKDQSWENKYKYKPTWLFTTALVFVTDGWHLSQMLFLNTLCLSVVLGVLFIPGMVWLVPLIGFMLMRVGFQLSYTLIKKAIK